VDTNNEDNSVSIKLNGAIQVYSVLLNPYPTMPNTNNPLERGIDMHHLFATLILSIEAPVEYKPDRRFVPDKRGTRSYRVRGHHVRGSKGRKNTKVKDMRHEQRS
tara:strand:- start:7056 stop:7370 length:315 start_codon:yes stop_codon:yes gene_type:complete